MSKTIYENPLDPNTYEEWDDTTDAMRVEALLNWSVGLLALFILGLNFQNPPVALPALFYAIFSLTRGTLGLTEHVMEKHPLMSLASFGSVPKILIGIAVGVFFGLILVAVPLVLMPKMTFTSFSIISTNQLSFLFTVIEAPILEEFFFRGMLFFTFALLLKRVFGDLSNWISMLTVNGMFAVFHIGVLGADPNALIPIFIIGIFFTAINAQVKSLAPSMALHMVWNYAKWAGI